MKSLKIYFSYSLFFSRNKISDPPSEELRLFKKGLGGSGNKAGINNGESFIHSKNSAYFYKKSGSAMTQPAHSPLPKKMELYPANRSN